MVTKPTHGGPGRGTPRARTVARPAERSARPARRTTRSESTAAPAPVAPARIPRLVRSVGFTRRALALLVVLAILVISYASSLRVYMRQETELARQQQLIAERTAANASLADEVARWNNPDFVRAQARERLGWVVPGEVGYRVIGPDGKPLDSTITINTTSTIPQGEHAAQWWDRLGGSLAAADQPFVTAPSAAPEITEAVSPSPTPSKASATPAR